MVIDAMKSKLYREHPVRKTEKLQKIFVKFALLTKL